MGHVGKSCLKNKVNSSTDCSSSSSTKILYKMFQNALNRHLSLRIFYLWCFHVSCFIFMFQLFDYQRIQEMKHTISMFHFYFQCFTSKKHYGSDLKTLRERFKNTEGAMKRSLSVLKNETWNLKVSVSAMLPCPLLFIIIPLPPNQNQ